MQGAENFKRERRVFPVGEDGMTIPNWILVCENDIRLPNFISILKQPDSPVRIPWRHKHVWQ